MPFAKIELKSASSAALEIVQSAVVALGAQSKARLAAVTGVNEPLVSSATALIEFSTATMASISAGKVSLALVGNPARTWFKRSTFSSLTPLTPATL